MDFSMPCSVSQISIARKADLGQGWLVTQLQNPKHKSWCGWLFIFMALLSHLYSICCTFWARVFHLDGLDVSSAGASVLEYAVSTCIRNGMLNATDQILIVRKAQEGFVAEVSQMHFVSLWRSQSSLRSLALLNKLLCKLDSNGLFACNFSWCKNVFYHAIPRSNHGMSKQGCACLWSRNHL